MAVLFALALSSLCASSCATIGTERHLAPLYTELSMAGGGVESEALGGALRLRRAQLNGRLSQWALRPIVIRDLGPGADSIARFFTPLGRGANQGPDSTWYLLPITRYDRHEHPGEAEEWSLITLPGIYWSQLRDGRIVRAWFPFGGVFEEFLSFDRFVFVLFPVFAKSERAGRNQVHFLFPVFAYTYGAGGTCARFWPLIGRNRYEGRYDRWFFLWPIFHFARNDLWAAPEKQEITWFFWPLIGRTTRASFRSTTILWPFLGWASDPSKDFWAFDAPWPFVRLLRDPEHDVARTRFWPVWSHYHGNGLDSWWYAWPVVNIRHEEYTTATKDAQYVIPFLQHWTRDDRDEGHSSYTKLWPLWLDDRVAEHTSHQAFPALNPLWRTPEIDEMYAWIWELYTVDTKGQERRERSWLGLWRREKDADEDRRSLVGLWSRRDYRDESGLAVSETSLLFGLIRWRSTEGAGSHLLFPALPGPGWPLERVHHAAAP